MANLLDSVENTIWHAFDYLALEGDGTATKIKLKVSVMLFLKSMTNELKPFCALSSALKSPLHTRRSLQFFRKENFEEYKTSKMWCLFLFPEMEYPHAQNNLGGGMFW